MGINIQTLDLGDLVLNNGQYYKVIAGNPFKRLIMTKSTNITYLTNMLGIIMMEAVNLHTQVM